MVFEILLNSLPERAGGTIVTGIFRLLNVFQAIGEKVSDAGQGNRKIVGDVNMQAEPIGRIAEKDDLGYFQLPDESGEVKIVACRPLQEVQLRAGIAVPRGGKNTPQKGAPGQFTVVHYQQVQLSFGAELL